VGIFFFSEALVPPESLIGTSAAARHLEIEISDAARSDAKVLLTGESGVGKEVVAKLIHQQSRRRHVKLVALNCAAVPDSLLESELFGHVRGSFTGAYRDKPGLLELANHGTIFLDEIGETSLRMQALMLRFLENGEVWRIGADRLQTTTDVRVIAATNRDLADRIAQREFRADLYYRLNVLHIKIPPLRERRDDIPLFLDHFFRAYAERHESPRPELTTAAMAALFAYDWPGNVRELKNVIERLVVRRRSGPIDERDLPGEVLGLSHRRAAKPAPGEAAPVRSRADELFDRMVLHGESFWSAVHPLFNQRDMTRDDLREIVARGLTQTRGSYRLVLQLFNMPPDDYKAFLNLLRKHQCHVPFFKYRCLPPPAAQADGEQPQSRPVEMAPPAYRGSSSDVVRLR
jgi:transcriptional regulator with PAS, ATPase and Fis domain